MMDTKGSGLTEPRWRQLQAEELLTDKERAAMVLDLRSIAGWSEQECEAAKAVAKQKTAAGRTVRALVRLLAMNAALLLFAWPAIATQPAFDWEIDGVEKRLPIFKTLVSIGDSFAELDFSAAVHVPEISQDCRARTIWLGARGINLERTEEVVEAVRAALRKQRGPLLVQLVTGHNSWFPYKDQNPHGQPEDLIPDLGRIVEKLLKIKGVKLIQQTNYSDAHIHRPLERLRLPGETRRYEYITFRGLRPGSDGVHLKPKDQQKRIGALYEIAREAGFKCEEED